ncbi:unnamed protein product [Mycena citricolor]|uniref:BOD1/SHG1 domain-containing protein n=1 Tax=Mycena citricolor TaxID=2018698 RepID=A0AAD2HH85_9AGAR|nr:unnamed protein product [Mycena citricolor]
MAITDPAELVEEIKKSGEFDKWRRELIASAQRSTGYDAFKTRVEEIARQRLDSGQLANTSQNMIVKEVNRFPIIDRFAGEVPLLADDQFKMGVRSSLERILRNADPSQGSPEKHDAPSQPSLPLAADDHRSSDSSTLNPASAPQDVHKNHNSQIDP